MSSQQRQVRWNLARLFGSSIVGQAVLSLANFAAGLLMLRNTSDADYGLYVLATSALLLITGAQGALITGPLSVMAPKKTPAERSAMLSTLLWAQFKLWAPIAVAGLAFSALMIQWGWISPEYGHLDEVVCIAAVAMLSREFLRQAFLIYSMPGWLLLVDLAFALIQVCLIGYVAVELQPAAPWAVLALAVSALISSVLAYRVFGLKAGWSRERYAGALAETWRLGKWGLAGAFITWLHTQGFYYLLAGIESAAMVAAVAAARLLLMPVNLLMSGSGNLLLPLAARWQHEGGTPTVVPRMLLAAGLLLGSALVYFGLLWVFRDWVVTEVLKREVSQLDPLLLAWGAVFFVMILRTSAMVVVQAQERFAELVYVALISTAVSLAVAWWAIHNYSAFGSVWGIIAGEIVDLVAIIWLIRRPLPSRSQKP